LKGRGRKRERATGRTVAPRKKGPWTFGQKSVSATRKGGGEEPRPGNKKNGRGRKEQVHLGRDKLPINLVLEEGSQKKNKSAIHSRNRRGGEEKGKKKAIPAMGTPSSSGI